jgi:hypothetical protein
MAPGPGLRQAPIATRWGRFATGFSTLPRHKRISPAARPRATPGVPEAARQHTRCELFDDGAGVRRGRTHAAAVDAWPGRRHARRHSRERHAESATHRSQLPRGDPSDESRGEHGPGRLPGHRDRDGGAASASAPGWPQAAVRGRCPPSPTNFDAEALDRECQPVEVMGRHDRSHQGIAIALHLGAKRGRH